MNTWHDCKRILCIRPDNVGDLLMSSPAVSALKETFGAHITLLTSSMANGIAPYVPAVDETLIWDVPWVKGSRAASEAGFRDIIETIRNKNFDAAVIFTVCSQNPLPTALMATVAGVPRRLAYCRENPYHLLSHWIPEKEPYSLLRHQVRRDLDLVASVGAKTIDDRIRLTMPEYPEQSVQTKLDEAGVDLSRPWLILHPGASEEKRQYPADLWVETGKLISDTLGYQMILTGTQQERKLTEALVAGIGPLAYSLAGKLSLEELITLIRFSPLLVSVNTGPAHIAAGVQTNVIVLYAMTNPQHPPWKTIGRILPFSVPENFQSKNEVLRFMRKKYYSQKNLMPQPNDIVLAVRNLIVEKNEQLVEELVLPFTQSVVTE